MYKRQHIRSVRQPGDSGNTGSINMNKKQKNIELKLIFWIIITLFLLFLAVPLLILLVKSFWGEQGATLEFYASVITGKDFMPDVYKRQI